MDNQDDRQKDLQKRFNELLTTQEWLNSEIKSLRNELETLPNSGNELKEVVSEPTAKQPIIIKSKVVANKKPKDSILQKALREFFPSDFKNNIEKFIGENLISVIGVVILIIGVGIGAKYAFEHQLISPLTRIIIGYLIATAMLVFAIKLKAAYENYSAVLLSGALAVMYFLTFVAYDFYDLIPKLVAFGLMVVFTLFTTYASIQYNRQVIAHIGFVGAYAVPFLLSDGAGSVLMLFSYTAIINIGILSVSLKKYWKSLYYTAFIFSWLIFIAGGEKLDATDDIATLFTFLTIFYFTFYAVFIGYKIINKEAFKKIDIILLLANSFVYYGLGYAILADSDFSNNYLGLFTLLNAIFHFAVATYINKQQLVDRNLFYLIVGLVLTFITIAIPVQLNGQWVTLLWIGEAVLLFWIGRSKQVPIYEKLSYSLIIIAFISILHDWDEVYGRVWPDNVESWLTPFFNIQFLSSILVSAGFGYINYINQKPEHNAPLFKQESINKVIQFALPASFLFLVFSTFSMEITNYWDQAYYESKVMVSYDDGSGETYGEYNRSIKVFGQVWSFIYTMFFFTVLSVINYKYLKNRILGLTNLGINAFVLLTFMLSGLYLISELRDAYLAQHMAEYFTYGWMHIGIRYIALVFMAAMVYVSYITTRQQFLSIDLKLVFAIVFYSTVLWLLSSELIHWMDYAGSTQSYKLGLSILWGVYSLVLVVVGIYRKYKPVRLGAIALFGITLVKLFFYDISHLNTIAKTIVFVVLGILLLVISFLYNKYNHLIFDNEPKD